MNIFVEPVSLEYLKERAIEKQRQIDEFENAVIFPDGSATAAVAGATVDQSWNEINEQVKKEIEIDDGVKLDNSDLLTELLKAQTQSRKPPPAEPKTALQRLKDLLSGQTREQASAPDNQTSLAEAQASAVNIIREASKFREADITDTRRSTRKEELTKLKAATVELDKWIDNLDTDNDDAERDEQVARLRDVTKRQLEECVALRSSHYDTSGPILALALTVRNKINGRYVTGPPEVNREDDWQIEYSIQEMSDNNKAWQRYDSCKARKDNASAFGKDDAGADEKWYGGRFMTELAEWSQRGAEWRMEQDEIDRRMGKVEVFEPIDQSPVDRKSGFVEEGGVGEDIVKVEEEVVKGVDEYMSWLFAGKGGDGKKE